MDTILKDILQRPEMMGREGEYIVSQGIIHHSPPRAILQRLPLAERIRLYASLSNPDNPHISDLSPADYHHVVSAVGELIDLNHSDTLATALEVSIGRKQFRRKKAIPENDKNDFDGFQNTTERFRQLYLAYVVSVFLPAALQTTPADFMTTRLSEDEQGLTLALLKVNRADTNATVQDALHTLLANIKLTPAVWNGFQNACTELADKPSHFLGKTSALVDKIVEREILGLSPGDIENLAEQQAYYYLRALGWSGIPTPSFRKAQLYFYQHLPPTPSLQELRDQQIDFAIMHFSRIPDKSMGKWQEAKDNWEQKSGSDKERVINDYASLIAPIIGIPQLPDISVSSWKEAPKKPKALANAYYIGWENQTTGDKTSLAFANKIVLVDDVDDHGRPLSMGRSLRSAISTGTHEILHSDDEQKISRFSDAKFAPYVLSVTSNKKPSKIQLTDPLGYTAGILFSASTGRTSYVSLDANYDIYRQQPFEKYAWSFQNQFAAALNGNLVDRQVKKGERNLQDELKSLFKKVGEILVARPMLTGSAADIVPLKNYERADHPFGALTMRDSETVENGVAGEKSAYVPVDFSKYMGKTEVLAYLQNSLERLETNRTPTLGDYIPLFKQSADFLIQIPNEIWAITKKLGPEDAELSGKLNHLAIKAQMLGEDLSDYSFVTERRKEIETHRMQEETKRAERQRTVALLTANL